MSAEQKGQYFFSEDEQGNFQPSKHPLGHRSFLTRMRDRIESFSQRSPSNPPVRLDNFWGIPVDAFGAHLLNKALYADLIEIGVVDSIVQETHTDSKDWFDHNRKNLGLPKGSRIRPIPDHWEVDIGRPRPATFQDTSVSCWSEGTIKIDEVWPEEIGIMIVRGKNHQNEYVFIRYDRRRNLSIKSRLGTHKFDLNTNDDSQTHLIRTTLREALENPVSQAEETENRKKRRKENKTDFSTPVLSGQFAS